MDIKLPKERYGGGSTLWDGISTENLVGGDLDDVEPDDRYAMRQAAPGSGIMHASSHLLADGACREAVVRIKETPERLGVSPIYVLCAQ